MTTVKVRKNPWNNIFNEIWHRFCNFGKSPKFIAFMFIGVIGVGGVGIWLPAIVDTSGGTSYLESQNVFTYSVAVLGTLFIEAFFGKKSNNLAAVGLIFGSIAFLICIFAYMQTQTGLNVYLNVGAVLALILFLMANVNDERFDDDEEDSNIDPTGFKNADVGNIKDKS